jgi:hypothetical protein
MNPWLVPPAIFALGMAFVIAAVAAASDQDEGSARGLNSILALVGLGFIGLSVVVGLGLLLGRAFVCPPRSDRGVRLPV